MDEFKQRLAAKVKDMLTYFRQYDDFNGYTVEVHDISPTELQLRCKSLENGPTRYFRVKLSEMM